MPSRRAFLQLLAGTATAFVVPPRLVAASGIARQHVPVHAPVHPEPRSGITGERVLASEGMKRRHRVAYDAARRFPAILDGLYCHCDCAERDGMRSLLECFESRMPQSCGVCLGEATLAGKLARRGMTLAEIRKAVDEKYA